jgi:hypothetical protein
LEWCQPLAVELSATLALEVHEIRRAVRPVLDPGVMPGDTRVIEVNVQPRDAADMKVGPFPFVDPFRPPAADQLECRAKRIGVAHDETFAGTMATLLFFRLWPRRPARLLR